MEVAMSKLVMENPVSVKDVENFLKAIFSKQKIELDRILFIARLPMDSDMTHVLVSMEAKIPLGSEIEITET